MEVAFLIAIQLILIGFSFGVGRFLGYRDAQPKRNKQGRFIKRKS